MKEIEMIEKVESAHIEYEPVSISEGINISATRDINGGVVAIEGNITRNGKNLGRYVFNEGQNRFFVNADIDDMKRSTKLEIAETIAALITKLTPEEAPEEDSEEETVEE